VNTRLLNHRDSSLWLGRHISDTLDERRTRCFINCATSRQLVGRQPSIRVEPFLRCTTHEQPECCPDGHLAKLLPSLSGVCDPVRCRCSRQIHGGKWRTSRFARRFFCSVAFASLPVTGVRDIPWSDVDLRCAEHQGEICVLSAPAHDRSRRVICGLGRIHSDGVSWASPEWRSLTVAGWCAMCGPTSSLVIPKMLGRASVGTAHRLFCWGITKAELPAESRPT
jgi:hypothetical protein